MNDRKYRQRGYMDSQREEREKEVRRKPETFGPRSPKMPGTHSVSRCASCGNVLPVGADPQGKCPQCGFELHCCKQCSFFDTSSRFECTKPITARIPRKDAKNECNFFSLRVTVERQTSSPGSSGGPHDARKAFENLFKK